MTEYLCGDSCLRSYEYVHFIVNFLNCILRKYSVMLKDLLAVVTDNVGK